MPSIIKNLFIFFLYFFSLFCLLCSCAKKEETFTKASISAEQQKTLIDQVNQYDGPLHIAVTRVDDEKPILVNDPVPLHVTFDRIQNPKVQWSIILEPSTGARLVNSETLTPSLIATAPGVYVLKVHVQGESSNSSLSFLNPIRDAYAATLEDSRLVALPLSVLSVVPDVVKPSQPVSLTVSGFEEFQTYDEQKFKDLAQWPYTYAFTVKSSTQTWQKIESYTSRYTFPSTSVAGAWSAMAYVKDRRSGILYPGPSQSFRVADLTREKFRIAGDAFFPPYLKGYIGCIHPPLLEDEQRCAARGEDPKSCEFQEHFRRRQKIGFFNLSKQKSYGEMETAISAGKIHLDSNYIYVADKYNHRVQIFNRESCLSQADQPRYLNDREDVCFCMPQNVLGKKDPLDSQKNMEGSGFGEFNLPMDVTTDENGMVYVLDSANKRIQVFDKTKGFQFVKVLPFASFSDPRSLAYVGGKLLVADSGVGIKILDTLGRYFGVFGNNWAKGKIEVDSKGDLYEFVNPSPSPWGEIYYSGGESRVKIYKASGNTFLYVKDIYRNGGKTDTNQTASAQDMAVDPNGKIYLASNGLPIFNAESNYFYDFISCLFYPYDSLEFKYFLFPHLSDQNPNRTRTVMNWLLGHNYEIGTLSVYGDHIFSHNRRGNFISILYKSNWQDRWPEFLDPSKVPDSPQLTISGQSKNVSGDVSVMTDVGTQVIDGAQSTLNLNASVSEALNPGISWKISRQATANQLELDRLEGPQVTGKINSQGSPLTLSATAQTARYFKSVEASKSIEFDVKSGKPKGDFTIVTPAPYTSGQLISVNANFMNPENNETLFYDWAWEFSNGQKFSSALHGPQDQLGLTVKGDMKISLYVSDHYGSAVLNRVGPFEKTITITNSAPAVSVAASPSMLKVGSLVNLIATASDADKDVLMYRWDFLKKPAGSILSLEAQSASEIHLTLDRKGDYEAQVTVSDGNGGVAKKSVSFTVDNTTPQLTLSGSDRVKRGSIVTIRTNAFDPDTEDKLTYRWELTPPAGSSLHLGGSTTASVSFTPDRKGQYVVKSWVSDGVSESEAATHTLTAEVDSPNAAIELSPTTLFIQESASLKALSQTVSPFLTYQWKLISKPAQTTRGLASSDQKEMTFVPDRQGKYEFELVVYDEGVASAPQSAILEVPSQAPKGEVTLSQAPYYKDKELVLGATFTNLESEELLTYTWKAVGGDLKVDPLIASKATFIPRQKADVKVLLTVSDGVNTVGPFEKEITITNRLPEISELKMSLVPHYRGDPISLEVKASDIDGDVVSYDWQWVDKGNSQAFLTAAGQAMTSFTPDILGTYRLKVAVKDVDGASVERVLEDIEVQNRSPIVTLSSTSLTSHVGESIQLTGAMTDPDSSDAHLLSFQWKFLKKPDESQLDISNSNGLTPSFTFDRKGIYIAQLSVSDPFGGKDSKNIELDVLNTAPKISLQSPDKVFRGDQVMLMAMVSDPDPEDHFFYEWSLVPTRSSLTSIQGGGSSVGGGGQIGEGLSSGRSFVPDRRGTYLVKVSVSDEHELSPVIEKTIQVEVEPPSLELTASTVETYLFKEPVILTGLTDRISSYLTWDWKITSSPTGSTANLSSGSNGIANNKATFSADKKGDYIFELMLYDEGVPSVQGLISLKVLNQAPTVDLFVSSTGGGRISDDQFIAQSKYPYIFEAVGADLDRDQDRLTYRWIFNPVSGSNSTLNLNNGNTNNFASLTPDIKGTYEVQVEVFDGHDKVMSQKKTLVVENVAVEPKIVMSGMKSEFRITFDASGALSATTVLGDKVTIDLSQTKDLDGDPFDVYWDFSEAKKCVGQVGYVWDPAKVCQLLSRSQSVLESVDGSNLKKSFLIDHSGRYTAKIMFFEHMASGVINVVQKQVEVDVFIPNQPPSFSLVMNDQPLPQVSGSTYKMNGTYRTPVSLKVNSQDPEGFPVSIKWSVYQLPTGSKAQIQTESNPLLLTPDLHGANILYQFMAQVSDIENTVTKFAWVYVTGNEPPKIKWVEQNVLINSPNYIIPGTHYVDDMVKMTFEVTDPENDAFTVNLIDQSMSDRKIQAQWTKITESQYELQAKLQDHIWNVFSIEARDFEKVGGGGFSFDLTNRPPTVNINMTHPPVSTAYHMEAVTQDLDHDDISYYEWTIRAISSDGSILWEGPYMEWKLRDDLSVKRPNYFGDWFKRVYPMDQKTIDLDYTQGQYAVRVTVSDGSDFTDSGWQPFSETAMIADLIQLAPSTSSFQGDQKVQFKAIGKSAAGRLIQPAFDENGNGYLKTVDGSSLPVTFEWALDGVPAGSFDTLSFSADKKGIYRFQVTPMSLSVKGESKTASVERVNQAPQLSLTTQPSIVNGVITANYSDLISFNGSGSKDSDLQDKVSCNWKITSPKKIIEQFSKCYFSYRVQEIGTYDVLMQVSDDDPKPAIVQKQFSMNIKHSPPETVAVPGLISQEGQLLVQDPVVMSDTLTNGETFVVDGSTHTIRIINSDGTLAGEISHPDFKNPKSISIGGPNHTVYVGDPESHAIYIFDDHQKLVRKIKSVRSEAIGYEIVVSDDGSIYTLTSTPRFGGTIEHLLISFNSEGREVISTDLNPLPYYSSSYEGGVLPMNGFDHILKTKEGRIIVTNSSGIFRIGDKWVAQYVTNGGQYSAVAIEPDFCDRIYTAYYNASMKDTYLTVNEKMNRWVGSIPVSQILPIGSSLVQSKVDFIRPTPSYMILGFLKSDGTHEIKAFDRITFENLFMPVSSKLMVPGYGGELILPTSSISVGEEFSLKSIVGAVTSLGAQRYSYQLYWNGACQGDYGDGNYMESGEVSESMNEVEFKNSYMTSGSKYIHFKLNKGYGVTELVNVVAKVNVLDKPTDFTTVELHTKDAQGVDRVQFQTGEKITLEARAPDVSITFKWDFNANDGLDWINPDATTNDTQTSFQYPGVYRVVLQSSNGLGQSQQITKDVEVILSGDLPIISTQSIIRKITRIETPPEKNNMQFFKGADGLLYLVAVGLQGEGGLYVSGANNSWTLIQNYSWGLPRLHPLLNMNGILHERFNSIFTFDNPSNLGAPVYQLKRSLMSSVYQTSSIDDHIVDLEISKDGSMTYVKESNSKNYLDRISAISNRTLDVVYQKDPGYGSSVKIFTNAQNHLFVFKNYQVDEYSIDGTWLKKVDMPIYCERTSSCTVDQRGNFWILSKTGSEFGYHILVFSPSGQLLAKFIEKGQLSERAQMVVTAEMEIYVMDMGVFMWTDTGAVISGQNFIELLED